MAVPVGPVVYQVSVNGRLIPDKPSDVSIDQAWGQHEVVSIRIEYNRGTNMSAIVPWPDNALVQMTWGRRPNSLQTWYGYVSHHELASNSDSGLHNLQYTYVCIGTSKPMNSESSTVWGDVSPTYIARQMALRYHLRCVVTSTAQVLPNETQANMSDFAYMNYVAQKAGYRFWVSGGTLYFIDPAIALSGTARQAVPAYRQDKILGQQDTVRDFRMVRGDNLPGSVIARRQVFGIDQTTGHLFTASTGGTGITKTSTNRVATSLSEAGSILSAWQGLSQFWIGAQAELFGSNLIYPGKVVYLDGQALPGGNIGYWIVVSARHVLRAAGNTVATNDKYVTQATIMRNSSATVPRITGLNVISPEFVTCQASGLAWYSSSLQVIENGVINGK